MNQKIPNTFALDVYANRVETVTTVEQLMQVWKNNLDNQPFIIIGQGSNTLFTENFAGTIIVNQIKGLTITETATHWHLKVGAGEY